MDHSVHKYLLNQNDYLQIMETLLADKYSIEVFIAKWRILFKSLSSIYYAQFIIWNCDAFISYMLNFVIWIFALFFPISWFLFLLWFCINEEFREWLKTKQKLFSKYLKEKSICTFHSEHIVKSKCSSAFKVLKEENVSCDYKNFYNTSSIIATGYDYSKSLFGAALNQKGVSR